MSFSMGGDTSEEVEMRILTQLQTVGGEPAEPPPGSASPLSEDGTPRLGRSGSAAWAGVGRLAAQRKAETRRHHIILLSCASVIALLCLVLGTVGDVNWRGSFTIGVLLADVVLMITGYGPDVVFLVSTCVLFSFGCVDSKGAFEGFMNQGVLAIGALFAVAQALYETGGIERLMRKVLGNPASQEMAVLRCCLPVTALSAFLANTPVVAMMIPLLQSWGERVGVPASKLLIPLSYASIVGGGCTMIGSSVNLIAAQAARAQPDGPDVVRMFDMAPIGLVQVVVATVYIVLASRFLPDTSQAAQAQQSQAMTRRSYRASFSVAGPPLAGNSYTHAGLHRVAGAKVVSVQRPCVEGSQLLGEKDPLAVGDVINFSATARAVSQLRQLPGTAQHGSMAAVALLARRRYRMLAECVCGPRCHLTKGRVYDGAHLIAVEEASQSGMPTAGDCCLVECFPEFITAYREAREHFALVAELPKSKPPRLSTTRDRQRMWAAAGVALAMIVVKTALDEHLPLVVAAVLALQVLVGLQCLTWREAFSAVDGRTLLTIACAFGVSNAMEQSGAATHVASGLVSVAEPGGKVALMAAVYLCTVAIGCAISNNAVVLLMTPIVFAARKNLAAPHHPTDDPLGWTLLIIFAGSSSFLTPVSYQTNLMVWQPGGYKFSDFAKFGGPLTLLLFVIGTGGSFLVAERVIPMS
eukprot:TRINITY_DN5161_c0_g1_i1.p1 TRINITY_DN5161_c0_g1~~TRINITY_DN5161_c0_g1_i1.p1  ORF type:complete len:723 (+),score=207.64 TRINITY_DN5161_c0_g1_i1:83-2170(+)